MTETRGASPAVVVPAGRAGPALHDLPTGSRPASDPEPTPAQYQAITAPLGPTLVVAGPGAGKTFCLIGRAHHLIHSCGLDPARICAVTFTNKAADEVATRLRERLGESAESVTRGTLHALCAGVLRERGESVAIARGFGIADEAYQGAVLRRLGVPVRRHGQLLGSFGRHRLQAGELTPDDARLFARYSAYLRQRNLVDFDDLMVKTWDLFRTYPEAAEATGARWDALLVDEFQDLDRVQYEIVRALASGHRNVFVVGDDEQSIFAWRGADSTVLRRFADDFGITNPIVLDRNLRCSRRIFSVARRLIEANPSLFAKRIEAERDAAHEVEALGFADEHEEAAALITDLVADRAVTGLPWGQYAILYRRHSHGELLEGRLLQAGIPCRLARGRALQDDPVIGFVAASLRLVTAPDDETLVELFAERELPRTLVDRVRAREGEGGEADGRFLTALREFAASAGRDPDARRVWRFIYHVENLRSAGQAHQNLQGLIEALLPLRIGSWENRLEREHDRLTDPADDPAARALAARLETSGRIRGSRVFLASMNGMELPLRSMLTRAGIRRVEYQSAGPPGPNDQTLGPRDAGSHGLPVTLFRALQILDMREVPGVVPRFVTFDLETTGRDATSCEIVELGAVRVVDGVPVERFQRLVRPTVPIHPDATRVHGISEADVAGAPAFAEVWRGFRGFIGSDLLVAHNAHRFDLPVLKRLADGLEGSGDLKVFDSLPLARALEPGSRKLEDLARKYGVDPGTSHRALDDALTLARVFPELERRRLVRARKAARVDLLDDLALALALEGGQRSEEAALLFDLARISALGRFSSALDRYAIERERIAAELPSVEDLIERLGGSKLMERLRTERTAEEQYPAAMERLRNLIAASGEGSLAQQVSRFLELLALSSSRDGPDLDPHGVNLLTLHATKGLEFSRVYIVGVENGNLPGYRAIRDRDEGEIQEGRRLLYVGMTRARDRLVLTRVARREGYDAGDGRFLDEMGLEPRAGA